MKHQYTFLFWILTIFFNFYHNHNRTVFQSICVLISRCLAVRFDPHKKCLFFEDNLGFILLKIWRIFLLFHLLFFTVFRSSCTTWHLCSLLHSDIHLRSSLWIGKVLSSSLCDDLRCVLGFEVTRRVTRVTLKVIFSCVNTEPWSMNQFCTVLSRFIIRYWRSDLLIIGALP